MLILFRITYDDTIGSPANENFVTPDGWGDQSAVEVDKGPGDLGLTAGYPVLRKQFEVQSQTQNKIEEGSDIRDVDVRLGDDTVVTVWAIKLASGDPNPTVSVILNWLEDH